MLDQELPLSPDKRVESAGMDFRSSVDLTCCHAIEGADLQCASSVPVLCAAVERASMPQSYVGPCAVEQACEFQGDVDFVDGAAATHDSTTDTVFDPGAGNLERPQMLSDIMDVAVEMEAQTELVPDHVSMPSVPTPHTAHSRGKSRSPRRHVEEESFGSPLAPVRLA